MITDTQPFLHNLYQQNPATIPSTAQTVMRLYCPYEYTTPEGEIKVEDIAPIASFATRPTKPQINARLGAFFVGLPESARPRPMPVGYEGVLLKYTL